MTTYFLRKLLPSLCMCILIDGIAEIANNLLKQLDMLADIILLVYPIYSETWFLRRFYED